MSESVRLSPAPPTRTSLDFAALREAGMESIRALAGETWTDHNLHDPGITLLEAFCYAMTELGFRIQLDPADLLRSGEAHAPAALVPAHRVLPSGPITSEDLRRLLLDDPLVADALITPGAEGEVRFYEDPLGDPPFSYAPGGPPARAPARPRGLFEAVTAFAAESGELNRNTYTMPVDSGGVSYTLDLALPHWDEDEATPFRAGATVSAVQILDPGSGAWRALDEPQSYFGQLRVDYLGPDGAQTVVLWVLLRIVDALEQPAALLPGILAAAETLVESTSADSLIDRFARRVRAAQAAANQVQRYLAARRNLCEEPVRLAAARVQEIALGARIEVTGGTDLERLLADVFLAVDRLLSPPLRFRSLGEMRSRGKGVEEIFDGPLLRHGFLDREELTGLLRPAALYTSDVLRLIMHVESAGGNDLVPQENPAGRAIVAVTDLRLSNFVNNRAVTTDAPDCLRLVEIDRYRPGLSLAKSRVVFVRDEVEVGYDRARVEELVQEGRRRDRLAAHPADPSPELPVPIGEVLPIEDYTPVQNDLPPLYALGAAGLPASASVERRAQALQARGYLHLFEQFLADHTAQLAHVNRFFSPTADEASTYFTRPLFDIPGADAILTSFAPGGDWPAFIALPDNPHRRALREAAESRDRVLDRRNRMLDHLLARQGEEAVAWGQELHRAARGELAAAGLPPALLAERMAARREAVNARLVRDKAAFLAEAPELAALRLQAFGMPWQGHPQMVRIEPDAAAFRWTLSLDGQDSLRSVAGPDAPPSAPAAAIAAEEAVVLAGQSAYYTVVAAPGGRRYRLHDGPNPGDRVVGESPTVFPSVAGAEDAAAAVAARFARMRLEDSLTPLERRIAHLTGIRGRERRRLLVASSLVFEIEDAAAGDGVVEGWRLRAQPGPAGAVLLTSMAAFSAATDAEALALARRSIEEAARYGLDDWNYEIAPPAAGAHAVRLRNPAEDAIARPPAAFPSRESAEQAVAAAIEHLYRHTSAEGFHLIEHLLLRPRQTGDAFLSLPAAEGGRERDPYSQRLTLVFPSGWARDFASPPGASLLPAAPHRFRDPEFRRHAQRVIRQACPAHLLPTIHWIDRDLAAAPSLASLEGFEARYFTWLATVLVPGGEPAVVRAARNELIGSMNALGQGAVP